jgi:AcrR family transcriptional regulator
MAVRMSRVERNAANREALLGAARRVFLRAGYHGTTVEAIATEAGLTIGALYSRFDGKADLFFALLEERIAERTRQFSRVGAAGRGDGPSRDAARLWSEIMRTDLDWQLLVIEFRVHAARHADLAARYAAMHERSLAGLATNIAAAYGDDVDSARVNALARAGQAAATGAALARAVEGQLFSDEIYEHIAVALAQRLLEPEES